MYEGRIDTADVLLNRGLNGLYGYGGNFVGDGSAINANVIGNRDLAQVESINRTGSDRFLSNQIDQGNQFLTDRINQQALNERFSSLERIIFNGQQEGQRDRANINAKLTECCCKLEAGQASILAKLDAQALTQAQAENARLHAELLAHRGRGQGND